MGKIEVVQPPTTHKHGPITMLEEALQRLPTPPMAILLWGLRPMGPTATLGRGCPVPWRHMATQACLVRGCPVHIQWVHIQWAPTDSSTVPHLCQAACHTLKSLVLLEQTGLE